MEKENSAEVINRMKSFKKVALILAIIIIGVLDVLIYWNFHLYYKAKNEDESKKKIAVLEKSISFYPINDLVFYEKGKAYFDLALDNLNDNSSSEEFLKKSINSFKKSLKSNPASYFSHFDFAQSLLYFSYLFPSLNVNSDEEYKKAAELAGENSQIYFEVSKIFLSRWAQLSESDKRFTLDILRKIINKRDTERLRTILYLWEMNLRNYDIIEKILPEDARIYKAYADFLGQKSMSLEERQKFLTKAEFLEFENIKEEYHKRTYDYLYSIPTTNVNIFKNFLNKLKKIKFYQNLTHQNLIDFYEFTELKKSILLNMSKIQLEQGKSLKEVQDYLYEYLSLEGKEAAISDLESYLRFRGKIPAKLEVNLSDLNLLAFELLLYFKKNRYREIVKVGRELQQSFVAVPREKQEAYVKILQIVGDAFQKVDYVYDAEDFYQKAMEIDPNNLETLIKIRQNYKRLNSENKISEINKKIDEVISPREELFKNKSIKKGQIFTHTLLFDEGEKVINLQFNWNEKEVKPLISVYFNGYVVWEDYLRTNSLSIPLKPKVGKNILQIKAVNIPIYIAGIKWERK